MPEIESGAALGSRSDFLTSLLPCFLSFLSFRGLRSFPASLPVDASRLFAGSSLLRSRPSLHFKIPPILTLAPSQPHVAKSLRLVQFSDPHLFGTADGALRGVATLPALKATMAHAERYFRCPDALLLTGDLVQDDPGGYALLRATFESSKVPVYCLAGNHDVPEKMNATLQGAPFQVGGRFIDAGWLVVMLDTWKAKSTGGRLGKSQLSNLEATLAGHPDLHVLLCLHHHPVAMDSRWLDKVGLDDAAEFLALIARFPQVRGVLWGHVHQSLDRFLNGVRFMASPATCAQFLPRSADFALDWRPPGYRVLELLADGTIATEVVWVENTAP